MKIKTPSFWIKGLTVALMAVAISVPLFSAGFAANRGPSVVVFTANWSASSRSVVPIIREVAQQNGVAVHEVDVDAQDAPSRARNFGLSIPPGDPPHAFLINNGAVTPLFDGRGFSYGKEDALRGTLLQNLRKGLGAGASGR